MFLEVKVVFCFIVKDGEEYLESNVQRILALSRHFKDIHIRYVENNSLDRSKLILSRFHSCQFSGIQVDMKDDKSSNELCGPRDTPNCDKRTRRLALLRQMVLDEAMKIESSDIIVMLDLDFNDFNDNDFVKMVSKLHQNAFINGIFGMSVFAQDPKVMYDTGAVIPMSKIIHILHNRPLVRVSSAFSGFGVYRAKYLRDMSIKYDMQCSEIEHISFHKQMTGLYVFSAFRPVYTRTLKRVEAIFLRFDSTLVLFYLLLFSLLATIIVYIGKMGSFSLGNEKISR
jgi:hypothetical protein